MHFTGDVPQGSGLSSSASLLMATGAALNTVFDMGYTAEQLAKLAQKTENEYIGVNCGIMDMFVSGLGRRGHGIYLNCGTMEYDYVPLNFGDFGIIIMDTKKPRALVESKYNERLDECKRGVEKRMRHVKSENERVGEAAAALRSGDMPALGRLFGASHASLRDDYEVSCRELDVLVGEAEKHPACRGARMTGAGFGGCAIALVARAEAEDFTAQVSAAYTKQIGYAPAMYSGESGDGGREIENGEWRI
jgi:galactokinase